MEIILAKSPGWQDALDECDSLSRHGYGFLKDLEYAHLLYSQPSVPFEIDARTDAASNEQKN